MLTCAACVASGAGATAFGEEGWRSTAWCVAHASTRGCTPPGLGWAVCLPSWGHHGSRTDQWARVDARRWLLPRAALRRCASDAHPHTASPSGWGGAPRRRRCAPLEGEEGRWGGGVTRAQPTRAATRETPLRHPPSARRLAGLWRRRGRTGPRGLLTSGRSWAVPHGHGRVGRWLGGRDGPRPLASVATRCCVRDDGSQRATHRANSRGWAPRPCGSSLPCLRAARLRPPKLSRPRPQSRSACYLRPMHRARAPVCRSRRRPARSSTNRSTDRHTSFLGGKGLAMRRRPASRTRRTRILSHGFFCTPPTRTTSNTQRTVFRTPTKRPRSAAAPPTILTFLTRELKIQPDLDRAHRSWP